MANVEARVPYVAQNDAGTGAGLMCGAAAIQAILYGLDDAHFAPASSATLKPGIAVRADQDLIWDAIKERSAAIAESPGFTQGKIDGQLLCEVQKNTLKCWATHPTVMMQLMTDGVAATSGRLSGVPAKAQSVAEPDIVHAIVEALGRGVGTALLIEGTHWVVVHKCVSRGDDFDIFFHDPETRDRTVWHGVDELFADVIDVPWRKTRNGPHTVLVAPTSSRRRRPAGSRRPEWLPDSAGAGRRP